MEKSREQIMKYKATFCCLSVIYLKTCKKTKTKKNKKTSRTAVSQKYHCFIEICHVSYLSPGRRRTQVMAPIKQQQETRFHVRSSSNQFVWLNIVYLFTDK